MSPAATAGRSKVAAIRAGAPASSAARHAVPPSAARSARNASAACRSVATASAAVTRSPVSTPATRSRSGACQHRSGSSAATSPRPSSSANRNRPGSAASPGRTHSPRSRAAVMARTSGDPVPRAGNAATTTVDARGTRSPPLAIPASGDASTLRTRSCVADGSSPAPARRAASAPDRDRPRSCRFPREVRCTRPSPTSCAQSATTRSAAAPITPPGSRIRASAPSAASCGAKTPGQASGTVRTGTAPL